MNYITYLKNKIQELSVRRNELKNLSNLSVVVQPCCDGVQILVTTNVNECLLLSEVLEILLREGLDVVHGFSSRENERLIYSIQSKVRTSDNNSFISRFRVSMKLGNTKRLETFAWVCPIWFTGQWFGMPWSIWVATEIEWSQLIIEIHLKVTSYPLAENHSLDLRPKLG